VGREPQPLPLVEGGVAAVVLCLVGAVWIARGTDALHGSGNSGHTEWAVIGGVVVVVGLALLAWAWRIRRSRLTEPSDASTPASRRPSQYAVSPSAACRRKTTGSLSLSFLYRVYVRVEVWSDVVCPWCYVGKRRLASALQRFEHRDEVDVVWRSFELDPDAPRRRGLSAAEHLARKYRMSTDQVAASWARLTALAEAEGLEFHLDRTQGGSTFNAHRLIHLGAGHGLQDEVKERFLRAYFTEGAPIGEPRVLDRLATEAGLPPSEVAEVLASDGFAAEVREDEHRARLLGIAGVPFFAIDERYGVSGAQSAELLLGALAAAWAEHATAPR
jgi:predicted DsbA family dithiol-disulfide isomerase